MMKQEEALRLKAVVNSYAEELERIYKDRTAGEHTFTGVLGSFLNALQEEDIDVRNMGL